MKTEILKITGDWEEVVNDCRATVKKPPLGHAPSEKFKKNILIAEHDPIRDIEVKWKWTGIKYWIAMHFKTHIWRSRTNSQRNDRQDNYDRNKAPQDSPVDFIGDANVQHLIDTSRKRMCFQASPETRKYWEDLKCTLHKTEPEIADVMVPNCLYRNGCPELKSCGRFAEAIKECPEMNTTDISRRYAIYNERFYEAHGALDSLK